MAKKALSFPQKRAPQAQAAATSKEALAATGQRFASFLTNRALMAGIIFALASALYLNTLSHQFALDDSIVIGQNIFTRRGTAGISGILTKDTFFGFFREENTYLAGGRYRPLTLVMFAVEAQVFGTQMKAPDGSPLKDDKGYVLYEYSPFVGHLGNLLLYGLLCIIVYRLFLLLFCPPGSKAGDVKGYFVAAAGAILFTAHPIHTEVVANIKGRDEILCLLFALLTCYWTLKAFYTPGRRILYLAGAVASYFLALFSKENPMTFLAVIPLMLFCFARTDKPLAAFVPQVLAYTAPFVVTAGVFWFGIRGPIVGTGVSGEVMELMNNPFLRFSGNGYVPISGAERFATVLHTWLKYLQLLAVPHPLTHDYYPRHIELMKMSSPTVVLSLLVHLGALVYALIRLPKKDPVAFGILYYLATFSVVSNLIFPVGTNMGERFMFIPSVGIAMMIALGAQRLFPRNYQVATIAVGVVALLYAGKTIVRNPAWHDDYTLFSTDVKTSPNSAKVRNALADAQLKIADKTYHTFPLNQPKLDSICGEALANLKVALDIHPTYFAAWMLSGNAHFYKREYTDALVCYEQVKKYKPEEKSLTQNIAVTYRDYGKYLGEQKHDVAGAINALEKAYAMRPEDAETIRLLGVAYGSMQQHEKAIPYFEKYVTMSPTDPKGPLSLGMAYFYVGRVKEALPLLKKGIEGDPALKQNLSSAMVAAMQ